MEELKRMVIGAAIEASLKIPTKHKNETTMAKTNNFFILITSLFDI